MKTVLFYATSVALLLSLPAGAQSPPDAGQVPPTTGMTTPDPKARTTEPVAADREFLDQALKSGETEIHAAQLAQRQAKDQDVRELAEVIERDHRDLNAKLEFAGARSPHAGGKHNAAPATTPATTPGTESADSAAAVGGPAASDPSAGQAANALSADPHMQPLLSARGEAFDQAYLDMLVQMHRGSIAKFEAAANGQGHSEEVRALAREALPGLRRHASMAESLDRAMAQE